MVMKRSTRNGPSGKRGSIIDVLARMLGTTESAKERRMSFRRLKRRYYRDDLSYAPTTFNGMVDLRGRDVKQRSDLLARMAELVAVTHLVNKGSTCGTPCFFSDERSRFNGSIPHQEQ